MNKRQSDISPTRDPFYYRHKNFFVGLFVLIPLLTIPALFVFTLVKSEILENWFELYIYSDSGTGLKKRSSVNILDVKVGVVHAVDLDSQGNVLVKLRIKRQFSHFLRKDTKARLKQKNIIVGDWEVNLTKGSDDAPMLHERDTLAVEFPLHLDKIVDQMKSIAEPVEKLLVNISQGVDVLKKYRGNDLLMRIIPNIANQVTQLFEELNMTLKQANIMIDNLSTFGLRGAETVDSFMVLANNMDNLIGNMERVAFHFDTLLIHLEPVPQDLENTLQSFQKSMNQFTLLLRAFQNHWLFRKTVKKQLLREQTDQ